MRHRPLKVDAQRRPVGSRSPLASHYSGKNPKGTWEEQEAVRTFLAHRQASAVQEGHDLGMDGETVYALMARLVGTADPHLIGLPPLDPDPDR